MYTPANHSQIDQHSTVSSLNTIIGRQYAAAIGGSIPPNQYVLVHFSVLNKYQEAIQELESRSRADKLFIAELLRGRDFSGEVEDNWTGPLNTSASAVVDSLLSTVQSSSFYQDETEDV